MSNEREAQKETPPSYLGELGSFCTMFAERSRSDGNAPYVRVWLAILENVIADEKKSRAQAALLLENVLKDRETQLTDYSREQMNSVHKYLLADATK